MRFDDFCVCFCHLNIIRIDIDTNRRVGEDTYPAEITSAHRSPAREVPDAHFHSCHIFSSDWLYGCCRLLRQSFLVGFHQGKSHTRIGRHFGNQAGSGTQSRRRDQFGLASGRRRLGTILVDRSARHIVAIPGHQHEWTASIVQIVRRIPT